MDRIGRQQRGKDQFLPHLLRQKGAGFSILELVVVILIIGILSGVVVVNWRSGQQELVVQRGVHKVAQDLRKAMEYTLRARDSADCPNDPDDVSGYGIFFEESSPNSYILFVNCNGENRPGYRITGNPKDANVELITMPDGVEIVSVTPGNAWSIAFFPPNPTVLVCRNDQCNGNNNVPSASILIGSIKDPTVQRTITVNRKGVIDID